MKHYIAYIHDGSANGSGNPYLWDWGPQLGDWLALDSAEGSYRGATDEYLVATAYYAYSTKILAKTAKVLGHDADFVYYTDLYEHIVSCFKETYMRDGDMIQQTQTAHVLPLAFELLSEDEAQPVIRRLVTLLEENGYALTTGFLGTPYLCQVLSDYGYADVAYRLLLRSEFPSWLYQVGRGATTIWEHWDGLKPDDTFWSPDMNSFNHYAYGSIGEWLYRNAAGIEWDEETPGYKRVVIRPRVEVRLGFVRCRYESVSGEIVSEWRVNGGEGTADVHVEIPANVSARIVLPDGETKDVGSGSYDFAGVRIG
jgi:alpha-L-rhamnosidase